MLSKDFRFSSHHFRLLYDKTSETRYNFKFKKKVNKYKQMRMME